MIILSRNVLKRLGESRFVNNNNNNNKPYLHSKDLKPTKAAGPDLVHDKSLTTGSPVIAEASTKSARKGSVKMRAMTCFKCRITNQLTTPCPSGFIPGHSTVHRLLSLCDDFYFIDPQIMESRLNYLFRYIKGIRYSLASWSSTQTSSCMYKGHVRSLV